MPRDLRGALAVAAVVFAVHLLTNHRYGFHRDELQVLDDARHLAWGYVVYPPLAPAVARLALELFGASLTGLRLFTALSQSIVIIVAALMARELGGGATASTTAAALTAIGPVALLQGALFQYVAFDLMWAVFVTWLMLRMIQTGDQRLWMAIGAAIGLGAMTRYTIAFVVAGVVAAVLLTPLRRHLLSRWLWIGAAISIAIALPNLIWQFRHDFISLEFLRAIHERDVEIGRTGGFLVEQLFVPVSAFAIPWVVAGLWFYLRRREYRPMVWLFVVPFVLFIVAEGRSYYTAPLYPMLLAAGNVLWERRTVLASVAVTAGALVGAALFLPLAPVGSKWFRFAAGVHDNFAEQIGWPELVQQVTAIYQGLDPEERSRTAIYASNYGEAGAINLYGPARGLPRAISGINSHWYRGYGNPPPSTVIVLGSSLERAQRRFRSCEVTGLVTNPWGIENEETRDHPQILLCRNVTWGWPALWNRLRGFG
jgi:4-amino-4-deoxy-L-arabinose transferase-like glycosyltransferase